MGGGGYSIDMNTGEYNASIRTFNMMSRGIDYRTSTANEIFKNRDIDKGMNPKNITIRESRDSEEHPNSIAIVLALDETGSMGQIPYYLIQTGLPNVMGKILELGISDPQMLFLGIGDHECDYAPLQVGQFESSDELLDKWLTSLYLEGNGGGNGGESYLLAWYFASMHTSIDCMEKRNQKGFLFTIGDEPTLKNLPASALLSIMGNGQHKDYTALELLEKAKEKYHVFHLHLKQGSNGQRQEVMNGWKELIGDNLIIIENKEDVSRVIPKIIKDHYKITFAVKTETLKNDNDSVVVEGKASNNLEVGEML